MTEKQTQYSLLDELEQRQDEVLAGLDDLNSQLESLLDECLKSRSDELEAALAE